MARRIRWQLLIAAVSSSLVLFLMGSLARSSAVVPRPPSVYIEGITSTPQHLNPLVSDPARDPAAADIQALLFEGLMRIGSDGLPEEALAQSWDVDESGTVYTFTVRPNVFWHDGTPLTAEDALFTLRAIQNRGFAGDPNAKVIWRNVTIDQVGERSVRCKLQAPFAPFLSLATFPILPAHLLRDVPPAEWASTPFSQKPIGTGPYQLAELTTEYARLTANPRYYEGRPSIDNIELRFFPNTQAARAALTRGDIMGMGYLSTGELGQINLPRNITLHTIPLDSYVILTFNLRDGPLADQEFRRALARGLDKDKLIEEALGGQAARLDSPILPGWWAAGQKLDWYAADEQGAADALTSLGYTPGSDGVRVRDGKPLTLPLITTSDPDRVAVANEIARQWGQLGVHVEVQSLDGQALLQRLVDHDFTLALYGLQRLGPDPDVYELWHSSQAESGTNYAGLQDDQIDELLANARQDHDIPARLPSYEAFQQRWVELVPSITLYQPLFVYATDNSLNGLDFDKSSGALADVANTQLLLGREARFRNVRRWSIRSPAEITGELRPPP